MKLENKDENKNCEWDIKLDEIKSWMKLSENERYGQSP